MKQKFYVCRHCGNLVAMLRDVGVPLYCCGEKMTPLTEDSASGAGEKHAPVCRREGDIVHVSVGAVEHPMTEEHFIEWVCLESEHSIQYAHLHPGDKPRAKFALCPGDEVRSVWAFCNQHELWRD